MYAESNYTLGERFLWNFYIIDKDRVQGQDGEKIHDFIEEATSIFFIMILCEVIALYIQGKSSIRINDAISSMSTGIMSTLFRILPLGIEFIGYRFLYQYRFISPDWTSLWTWWIAAVLVDFCYYWVHRMSHEVNLLWSIGHHVHHSSEEYNLSTAVRQPAFLKFLNHGLYHPLALLGVPLHVVLVHTQFNLIYQFWIHTEAISNIGPLEYIFNTASHHRVHHGMNNWCLDKNYASVFIIWDRIFGTFQAEKKEEKIYYGLVSQPQTFEPTYLQTFYGKEVIKRAWSMKSWSDCFKGIFYGPAWYPGSPRLGDEPDMSEKVVNRKKYNPTIPWYITLYVLVNFVIILLIQKKYVELFTGYTWLSILVFSSYLFWSLFNIGCLLNGDMSVDKSEVIRCLLSAAFLDRFVMFNYGYVDLSITACLGMSAIFWLYMSPSESKSSDEKIKH